MRREVQLLEADSRLHCIGSGGEANKRCARRGDARLGPGRRHSLLLVPLNDRLERAETRPVKVDVAQRRVRQHAQQHVAHALLARRAAAPEVAEKVGEHARAQQLGRPPLGQQGEQVERARVREREGGGLAARAPADRRGPQLEAPRPLAVVRRGVVEPHAVCANPQALAAEQACSQRKGVSGVEPHAPTRASPQRGPSPSQHSSCCVHAASA